MGMYHLNVRQQCNFVACPNQPNPEIQIFCVIALILKLIKNIMLDQAGNIVELSIAAKCFVILLFSNFMILLLERIPMNSE